MAKEPKLDQPEDVTHLQIDEKYVRDVQARKINELNEQNTLLLALANQQNDQLKAQQEVIDELSQSLENRQQRRAKPKTATPSKKRKQ